MNIFNLLLGVTRAYVIQDTGTILVDCGPPNKLDTFLEGLKKASIDPKQIKLIVQTHAHWDHAGSTGAIKEITGAQLAVHEPDREWLEKSLNQLPPAATTWGKILNGLMSGYMRSVRIPPAKADIILDDLDFSLTPFGIPGKVLYTPGHSAGSVSVLLKTGDAFVGDLAMNSIPFGIRPGLPVWADDLRIVRNSWKKLLAQGARTIYPAHGKPFSIDTIRKSFM
jgi:hydroxyacylglutathione hydrolase